MKVGAKNLGWITIFKEKKMKSLSRRDLSRMTPVQFVPEGCGEGSIFTPDLSAIERDRVSQWGSNKAPKVGQSLEVE